MSSKRTFEEFKNRPYAKGAEELGFLFYVESIPFPEIHEWLRVQDFVDEVKRLRKCNEWITIEVLYSIMKPIMDDILEYGMHKEDLEREVSKRHLKRGLSKIQKSLICDKT